MKYPQLLETLLRSSTVYTSETCDDVPADNFEPSKELCQHLDTLYDQFQHTLENTLPDFEPFEDCNRECDEFGQMQHDFILTVNRHGAGFWDGDWKSGDELTEICHLFREIEIYLGDDNLVHLY